MRPGGAFVEKEACFRNKITWFSFIFSVLVVWVHSANGELFLGKSGYARSVILFERFLGNTIAQIAVPGFFMMSGYLFYRNFHWKKLGEKWKSRIKSLLMPFLLWNTIYYLGYVIGSRLPFVTDIVEKGTVPFEPETIFNAVIRYQYNYVFWYLYQLILLVFLAPMVYGILKHKGLGGVMLGILYYFVQKGRVIPYLNLDALLYYGMGAYGGIHGKLLVEGIWTQKKEIVGAGMISVAVAFLFLPWPRGLTAKVCYRIMMPIGLWLAVDASRLPKIKPWMEYNFFLYAIHFALVRLVNKTVAIGLWGYWPIPVALFLFMPMLMIWVSSFVGSQMKRWTPRLWGVLNGGR